MQITNRLKYPILVVLISFLVGNVAVWAFQEQTPRKLRKVKRVKRPEFQPRDWDGIFFENLFKEGLVGSRPNPSEVVRSVPKTPSDSDNETVVEPGSGWSQWIPGSVIEDEVKYLQQFLNQSITTPNRFKSDYAKSHQAYSMLSMLFGIIHEYDDDVRWKKYASVAQPAFARAAANSRVGTIQAYQNAKLQKENLTELVRGGQFNDAEPAVEIVEWPVAVRRNPIMERLSQSDQFLKTSTANKTEYVNNLERVVHEAHLVAAMAQVLLKEDMEAYDEESYVDYANSMSSAAIKLVEASEANNFEEVAKQFNLIQQSCSNCHDEWQ